MFKRPLSIALASFLVAAPLPAAAEGLSRLQPPPQSAPAEGAKPQAEPDSRTLPDKEIIAAIIAGSIAAYMAGGPGPCACPYHRARNGSECGGRSAYSRAGGWTVKCYPTDVTAAEIKGFRERR